MEEEECISLVEEEGSVDSLRAWLFFLRPSISSGRSRVEEGENSRRWWLEVRSISPDPVKDWDPKLEEEGGRMECWLKEVELVPPFLPPPSSRQRQAPLRPSKGRPRVAETYKLSVERKRRLSSSRMGDGVLQAQRRREGGREREGAHLKDGRREPRFYRWTSIGDGLIAEERVKEETTRVCIEGCEGIFLAGGLEEKGDGEVSSSRVWIDCLLLPFMLTLNFALWRKKENNVSKQWRSRSIGMSR